MSTNDWITIFDECRKINPERTKKDLKEQFVTLARSIITNTVDKTAAIASEELVRLAQDYLWKLDGKPYYTIHPKLVQHLCRCDLTGIPATFLEVPAEFHAVHLRIPERNPMLTVSETEYVRSIFVADNVVNKFSHEEVESFFQTGENPKSISHEPSELIFRIDLGERNHDGDMLEWVIPLTVGSEGTIGESFGEVLSAEGAVTGARRREIIENCIRLVVTVGLIANCPENNLLEYDVLSKDKQKFKTAAPERREELIAKARRRGKVGWNVGTNELFIGERPLGESASTVSSGGSHNHAHIRTGHFRAVRFGKGRRQVKIKWIRPTVVRPDLPFNSGDQS